MEKLLLVTGRLSMGRKKRTPVKERSIYVYPPSNEMANIWREAAKDREMSISKFITEVVEDYIHEGKGAVSKDVLAKTISDLKEQNERLRSENVELQKKVDMLEVLTDRYEKQLQEYRNKTFIENDKFEGVREYQQNLIELFKQRTSIAEDEIIDLLHINPQDVETLKAISKQIENLADYGAIEKIRGGWRWKK
jgi:hypothetical protein